MKHPIRAFLYRTLGAVIFALGVAIEQLFGRIAPRFVESASENILQIPRRLFAPKIHDRHPGYDNFEKETGIKLEARTWHPSGEFGPITGDPAAAIIVGQKSKYRITPDGKIVRNS